MTTINFELALAHQATPAEWLDQVDRHIEATVEAFTARGRHREAWACMAGHLERTEVTRARIHGPGPDPATVAEGFNHAADNVRSLKPESGASTSPRPVVGFRARNEGHHEGRTLPSAAGEDERTTDSRPSSLRPRLCLVPPPPVCGQVAANGMVCAADPDHTPGRHHYVTREA